MEKNNIKNLTLNQNMTSIYSEVDGLSLQNLFYVRNGFFPNCQMFTQESKGGEFTFDTDGFLNYLIKNTPEDENFEYITYAKYNMTTKENEFSFCAVLNKSNLYLRIETCPSESYILFDNEGAESVNKMIEKLSEYFVEPEVEKNNLWKLGTTSSGGYTLIKSKVKEVESFNIDEHYNDDFKKEDTKIKKFIKTTDNGGLVILHGEKGTGKSTYIRHLININEDKKFVYVPASIIPLLGEPSFGFFLQTLANHVIILEDCENAIKDRKTSASSSAVSLILNMTDGLLEDDLGIKFICTFNEDVKNIDPALLRKGRLVSKYEFKPLDEKKTKKLVEKLYGDRDDTKNSSKKMTLADIYNYEEDSYEQKIKSII